MDETDQDARAPASDQSVEPLAAQQGFANAADERLAELSIPRTPSRLLHLVRRKSFGNAGYAKRRRVKEPGMSCDFDYVEWEAALQVDRANLRRALYWLVDHHILVFLSEPGSGSGRLKWNENTKEWTGSRAGGARPGAGAPAQNQNARKYPASEQPDKVSLIDSPAPSKSIKLTQLASSESIKLTQPASLETIKLTQLASHDAGRQADPASRVKNLPREETNPSGLGRAPLASAASSGAQSQDARLAKDAHDTEAAYVSSLVRRLQAHPKVNGAKLPSPGKERGAGHWFYTAGPDGQPADPKSVMALYDVVKADPHYSGRFLSLAALQAYWPDWLVDSEAVKANIAREQEKDTTRKALANGKRPGGRPAPAPARLVQASPMAAWNDVDE